MIILLLITAKGTKEKNGKIKYNGKWMQEGASGFPWEKKANK